MAKPAPSQGWLADSFKGAVGFESFLIGQDPLAIARHFSVLTSLEYPFIAHIPTISGIDIALWDLAGKIMDRPLYQLLGGPFRLAAPVYSHGNFKNMLDPGEVKAWAEKMKAAPEGFDTFKCGLVGVGRGTNASRVPYVETLNQSDFVKAGKGYANIRAAVGDDIQLAMHCTGEFDTRSAIGLCRAIEPINATWIEDPISNKFSEGWMQLKAATRVPLLAGEKMEMLRGFRPFLDNGVLDMVHPDPAYAGGITGVRQIADYAQLTRTPVGLHSGPCSLVRFYASVHLSGAIENFFKIEDALGDGRGSKEKMALGAEPMIRNGVMQFPKGPGLGLEINDDWLKEHMSKGELWWD